jgi:hypothetical protein
MKFRDVPQSGSRGNTVASRNQSGQYHRERVSPAQPATYAHYSTLQNMCDVSRLWNLIEEERRLAWGKLAEGTHSRPNLGQSGRLSGCQLFKKLNRVLATCQRPPLLDPPPLPQFGPNPISGFVIRKNRTRIVFSLNVSPKLQGQPRPPLEDLMLWGWAPCHAGMAGDSLYAFLGLLPWRIGEHIDFTDLYLKKLEDWRKLDHRRYHVPLEGSKIFIRVVQQVNGWKNELGRFQACAQDPRNRHLRARELAALLRRWPGANPVP